MTMSSPFSNVSVNSKRSSLEIIMVNLALLTTTMVNNWIH